MGFSRQEYWSRVPSPSPKWALRVIQRQFLILALGQYENKRLLLSSSGKQSPQYNRLCLVIEEMGLQNLIFALSMWWNISDSSNVIFFSFARTLSSFSLQSHSSLTLASTFGCICRVSQMVEMSLFPKSANFFLVIPFVFDSNLLQPYYFCFFTTYFCGAILS